MSSETGLSGRLFLQDSATSDASTQSSTVNWIPRKEDLTLVTSLADSLLASITEITVSVESLEEEQETFIEIGCYFYRASIAIAELRTAQYAPVSAVEDVLRSLSESVAPAAGLVQGLRENGGGPELRATVSQLEEAVRSVGERLSSVPPSAFGDDEYAGIAVRSLSRDMLNSRFEIKSLSSPEPEPEPETIETDLYSVLVMPDTPPRRSLTILPQVAHYMEPLYATFCCPLTKEIMDDPVTLETGATYERKAIVEWFENHGSDEVMLCPGSGKRLRSQAMTPNAALRSTIEEWKERNEAARIKVARAALSLAGSDEMIFEAIKDVHGLCERNLRNKARVFGAGMLPLLARTLEYKNQDVRCAVLELLTLLAKDDIERKEIVAEDLDIAALIRMLSSDYQPVRHASLALLLELSRCESLCDRIGLVPGAILMLITIKYRPSVDAFASEKAGEALKNLERSPKNVKRMAENGLFEPLLSRLSLGSEDTKTEMASFIGENIIGDDSSAYVAERASRTLFEMVRTGSALARGAAFKALAQISLHRPNAKLLAEAGVVQIMAEEMFTRRIYDELVNSKAEAAAILANVLEAGLDPESLRVSSNGHTMASDYVVYNAVQMMKNSAPDELNVDLVRILLCLTKTPRSMASVLSVVKETEASYVLVELVNAPNDELGIAAAKLLASLSLEIGHTLAERLCRTRGQPEGLVRGPTDAARISERHAVSARLLARLPHQNLTLNSALIFRNAVPAILETIGLIQRSGTRSSRHSGSYLEGLIGVLVRFTTTLYDPHVLATARAHNFTAVFTELLAKTSSDEVQRLSAVGLENLSAESINLSKPPAAASKNVKKPKFFVRAFSRRGTAAAAAPPPPCRVHRGECSSRETFCLVEAGAVVRLMGCVDHENPAVVEAALAALCTLLDERVEAEGGVRVLSGVEAVRRVLGAVREHREEEGVRRRALWMIERFLTIGGGGDGDDISRDRLLPSTLVSAFHHGDGSTRQMAENILRRLNKMPSSVTTYYSST